MDAFKIWHKNLKTHKYEAVAIFNIEDKEIDLQLQELWHKTNSVHALWTTVDQVVCRAVMQTAGTIRLRSSMVGDVFENLDKDKAYKVEMTGFSPCELIDIPSVFSGKSLKEELI